MSPHASSSLELTWPQRFLAGLTAVLVPTIGFILYRLMEDGGNNLLEQLVGFLIAALLVYIFIVLPALFIFRRFSRLESWKSSLLVAATSACATVISFLAMLSRGDFVTFRLVDIRVNGEWTHAGILFFFELAAFAFVLVLSALLSYTFLCAAIGRHFGKPTRTGTPTNSRGPAQNPQNRDTH